MAWYDTGTVSVTNGSTTVTGSGTNFVTGVQVGEAFKGPDDNLYEIASITSATVLVLADNYLGSTQSGQGYKIVPTQSLVADLAADVTDLISDYATVKDNAGAGKFADGTAASPAIKFEQDQDTGFYRVGANEIGVSVGGVSRLSVDSAGIDVTGTVTADGLTVNSTTGFSWLPVSTAGAEVGTIGTGTGLLINTPSVNASFGSGLAIDGSYASSLSSVNIKAFGAKYGSYGSDLNLFTSDDTSLLKRQTISSNGDISFFEDTGTTPKFFWDAANERLGIGTSQPASALDVTGGAKFTHDVDIAADDRALRIGAGADLALYHDAVDSTIRTATGKLILSNTAQNQDIIFKGNDAGATITALTLDMSDSGKATFNSGADFSGTVTSDGLTVDTIDVAVSQEGGVLFGHNAQYGMQLKQYSTSGGVPYASIVAPDDVNGYLSVEVGGSQNEAMRFNPNGDISFYDNTGSAKFHWDAADESLGIGTSSPERGLHLKGTINAAIRFQNTSNIKEWELSASIPNVGNTGFSLHNVTDNTIPLHVDNSGNVLVGTTTSQGTLTVAENQASHFVGHFTNSNANAYGLGINTGSGNQIYFYHSNSYKGSIVSNSSGTAYNTSSDYRLKEDVQPVANASDRLMALKPCNFAWKADGSRVDGFLAHEAQEVVPESVTGTKDAMRTEEYEVSPAVYEDVVIPAVEEVLDEDGMVITEAQEERTEQQLVSEAVMGEREVADYQGIDQSKLVPLLTAALQEALARIEALENK